TVLERNLGVMESRQRVVEGLSAMEFVLREHVLTEGSLATRWIGSKAFDVSGKPFDAEAELELLAHVFEKAALASQFMDVSSPLELLQKLSSCKKHPQTGLPVGLGEGEG